MTKKFLLLSIIIFSVFTLSACSASSTSNQNQPQYLNPSPTNKPAGTLSPEPTVSDSQLEKDLNNSSEPNIDQNLNDLEKSLQ